MSEIATDNLAELVYLTIKDLLFDFCSKETHQSINLRRGANNTVILHASHRCFDVGHSRLAYILLRRYDNSAHQVTLPGEDPESIKDALQPDVDSLRAVRQQFWDGTGISSNRHWLRPGENFPASGLPSDTPRAHFIYSSPRRIDFDYFGKRPDHHTDIRAVYNIEFWPDASGDFDWVHRPDENGVLGRIQAREYVPRALVLHPPTSGPFDEIAQRGSTNVTNGGEASGPNGTSAGGVDGNNIDGNGMSNDNGDGRTDGRSNGNPYGVNGRDPID
ncbi:hypothetical protein P171DRAFT_481255 [Karstenula rhodostoma CBS 690.94]|uniref:Uncharacterized protein n=1 Tax=Karstenula rhodostoma CBS 690.94 TaxID=1392251 RepID=A0A9P4UG49_9PLEO|nr:hypothetical protein P171DRAFT_481255 [Karstenula rhodostoma CBS 690.94]